MRFADCEQVEAVEADLRSRVDSLSGASTAQLRKLRSEFSQKLTATRAELVIQMALNLTRLHDLTLRWVAFELVQHHKAAFRALDATLLEKLGQGIDSWAAVDAFACYLAGPAWREGQIKDKAIERWSHSKNRWWRRAALVSTVPLNCKTRGGRGNSLRTLRICELLASDRDDMVVKALSWALRELAKHDPDSVREFMIQHSEELAPRVRREVENKLRTGLKNPGKRSR